MREHGISFVIPTILQINMIRYVVDTGVIYDTPFFKFWAKQIGKVIAIRLHII